MYIYASKFSINFDCQSFVILRILYSKSYVFNLIIYYFIGYKLQEKESKYKYKKYLKGPNSQHEFF